MARHLSRELLLIRAHLGNNRFRLSTKAWGNCNRSESTRPPVLSTWKCLSTSSHQSESLTRESQDRIEMFILPEVQGILRRLTERDYQRVFRKRKIGQKVREPKYTFMTEDQLRQSLEEAEERADVLLQMPPVLRARKPINKILAFDPELQGVETSTLIFTDITMNVSDRDRLIVARDPDGVLRQASWEERDKMNMIYFPREGKELKTPTMFTDPENLKNVLNRSSEQDNTYEFILDRASLQFEPDDPLYISVCETTYAAINKHYHFDFLKSTRHYGPMVFYLVRTRQMDNMLLHSIKHERLSTDCIQLLYLFHILFPQSKSKTLIENLTKDVDKLRGYTELDAVKKTELEIELNAYEEAVRNKESLIEELEQSHGIKRNSN